jgi:hypothetical protein
MWNADTLRQHDPDVVLESLADTDVAVRAILAG